MKVTFLGNDWKALGIFIILFGSATFYERVIFMLLLPVLVISFIVCLIRFCWRPMPQATMIRFLFATAMLVIWGFLFEAGDHFGDDIRWSIWSASYKERVHSGSTLQADTDANIRHMLWRVWGGLGTDTEADLVFDPGSALARTATERPNNKKSAFRCPVVDVHQLERSWYIVTLFANESWPGC
jgi:hypothetical protein